MTRGRQEGLSASAEERLQELLDGLAARRGIEHAIVAVESGDRTLQWVGAKGPANQTGEAMQSGTPFFIASIDKLFTATAIMQLYERGLIALDESIASYLPADSIAGLHRMDGVDRTGEITVRHLLGHTSGLADFIEDRPKGGRSLVEELGAEHDRSWEVDEALDVARRIGPHFEPQPADAARPRIRYCDTNYLLLIAIAQAVTGRALHEVYASQIWEPLGLRHTYLYGFSEPAEPAPAPATLWFGAEAPELPLAMRSLFSVYSTATDLLAFLRAFVGGEVFEDPATRDLMQARWIRFGFPRDRAALRAPSWPIEYGLGIMRFRLPRALTPIQPVHAVVGHSGSTGTWLFHCPDLDLYLTGAVDQVTAGAVPYRFVPRLLRSMESPARA